MKKISAPESPKSNDRIISMGWLYFLPLLFGPFVGSFFLAKNFRVLGCKKCARNVWLLGVAIFILLFIIVSFPMTAKIFKHNHTTFAIGYAAIFFSIARVYQHEKYKKFIETGGKKYSVWKLWAFTLLIAFLTIIAGSLLSFLIDYLAPGHDFSNLILYS
ncbi:MAG: hypothetical protein JSR33_07500 [Proteobacteria bacterium]|nr:hypothetical protein [Pseudomonadota bacterium]